MAPAAKLAEFRGVLARLDAASDASRAEPERATATLLANQLRGALAPADTVEYGAVLSDWGMWFLPYPVTQLSGPQDEVPKLLASQHTVVSASTSPPSATRCCATAARRCSCSRPQTLQRLPVLDPGVVDVRSGEARRCGDLELDDVVVIHHVVVNVLDHQFVLLVVQ